MYFTTVYTPIFGFSTSHPSFLNLALLFSFIVNIAVYKRVFEMDRS
jgi:hypothetical protein